MEQTNPQADMDNKKPITVSAGKLMVYRTTYAIEKNADPKTCDKMPYFLRGVRGALYGLMRNLNQPHMMFAINANVFGMASSLRGIWFTDQGGDLRAITH